MFATRSITPCLGRGFRTGPDGQSGSAQSRGAGFATELDEECRAGRRQPEERSDREPEACVRAIDRDDGARCVGRPYECEEDEQADRMDDDARPYRVGDEAERAEHHIREEIPEQDRPDEALCRAVSWRDDKRGDDDRERSGHLALQSHEQVSAQPRLLDERADQTRHRQHGDHGEERICPEVRARGDWHGDELEDDRPEQHERAETKHPSRERFREDRARRPSGAQGARAERLRARRTPSPARVAPQRPEQRGHDRDRPGQRRRRLQIRDEQRRPDPLDGEGRTEHEQAKDGGRERASEHHLGAHGVSATTCNVRMRATPPAMRGIADKLATSAPAVIAATNPICSPSAASRIVANAPPMIAPMATPAVANARETATTRPCSLPATIRCRSVTTFTFHIGVITPERADATPSTTNGAPARPSGAIAHARPSIVVAMTSDGPMPSFVLARPASVAPSTLARPPVPKIHPAATGPSPNAR